MQEIDLAIKLKLYDKLCDEAQALLEKYQPCGIENGKCLRGKFCCEGCKHLVSNECSIRSLVCKLWLCDPAARRSENKEFIKEAEKIFYRGMPYGLMVFRGGRDDIFLKVSKANEKVASVMMPWGKAHWLNMEQ